MLELAYRHGLDGPEITSSWPAQPQIEEAESFEEFWAEDDNDAEYEGLFPGEDPGFDARRKASTRTKAQGRRTGRKNGDRGPALANRGDRAGRTGRRLEVLH